MGKILKILFIVLIFITLLEIGYYVYHTVLLNKDFTQKSSDKATPPPSIIPPRPSPTFSLENLSTQQTSIIIRSLNKSLVKKAILEREFEGTVEEITLSDMEEPVVLNSKMLNQDVLAYNKFMVTFRNDANNEVHSLFYSEKEIDSLKFFLQKGNSKTAVSYSDIKKGDKIKIIEKTYLKNETGEMNLISAEIIKL